VSEFELGILRSRMYEAARSKAQRGELRISIPIGYTRGERKKWKESGQEAVVKSAGTNWSASEVMLPLELAG